MLRRVALCGLGALVIVACGGTGNGSGFGDGTSSGGSSGAGSSGGNGFGGQGSSGGAGADGGKEPEECKKMDIVFAIDNSGSMRQEQGNLATNFPKFVQVINDYRTKSGEELDYRLAVTSTDVASNNAKGKFLRSAGAGGGGCSPGVNRAWLQRSDGDVGGPFSCRAQIGTNGSNTELPLEALNMALTTRIQDKSNTDNGTSFIREDALLALVILTDEDEGGTENRPARTVTEYPGIFDGIKGERGRWATAVIAGETACSSPNLGNAAEAKRLKQFVGATGKNAVFSSICEGDLSKGLERALAVFDQACRDFPAGPVK